MENLCLHSGDFFYSDNTLGNIVSQFNDNDIILVI